MSTITIIGPFGFHPNKTMRSRALPLARELVKQGHQVHMLMPPWQTPQEADRAWVEDGVQICYVPLKGGILGITRQLVKEALATRPDVIYCFKPKAYSGLAAWWLWYTKRQHIHLLTDTDDWEGWGGWNDIAPYSTIQKYFFAWQEQWGITHCHTLTVASRELEKMALAAGAAPERVVYLPNGSGLEGVRGAAEKGSGGEGGDQRPTVLLYSRLFEFDTGRLVDILKRVKQEIPEMQLLSVGAGLYEQDAAVWREQLATAGLLDSVTDVGWLEEKQLPQTLQTADVAIYLMEDTLLNRTKCPVKLADLVMLGIPVVGEAVGQVQAYIDHGRTGFVRPSGDNAGIAADLVRLLKDQALRQQFGEQAAIYYQKQLAWKITAEKLRQHTKLLEEKI